MSVHSGSAARVRFSIAGGGGLGRRRLAIVAGVGCCLLVDAIFLSRIAVGQPPGVLQETVSLEVSPVATRRLSVARELATTEDWRTLLDAIDEIRERHRGEIVAQSSQRFVSVEVGVQELIATLPAAGIEAYRSRHEPLWSKRFEVAIVREDEAELDRIADEGFGTLAAVWALQTLGQLAWERGDFDRAAHAWQRLARITATAVGAAAPPVSVPTGANGNGLDFDPRDAALSRAVRRDSVRALTVEQIAARLILVDLLQGDRLMAQRKLVEFQRDFPTQTGQLAGREGGLGMLLQETLDASRFWKSNGPDWSWKTAGGSVTRNGARVGQPCEVGPVIWSRPTPFPRSLKRLRIAEQVNAPQQPATFVVSIDERCYLQELDRVRAFAVRNGAVAWPVELEEESDESSSGGPIDDGTIFAASAVILSPLLSLLGEEFFAPLLVGDDLIAVIGWPIGLAGTRESRGLPMQVVCLDVGKQEGKLRWSRDVTEWLPGGNWRISGPGLADQERVYFPIRQGHPNMAVGVLAVNRHDGTRLWQQTLCGVLSTAPTHYHVITSDQLAFGDDRLYVRAAGRATICVDPVSGGVRWVTMDDPAPRDPDARVPVAELPGLHPLVDRGVVSVVQSDRRTIQSLDSLTGETRWKRTLASDVTQTMGSAGGVLVLAGEQLWGVEMSSGKIRWRFGFDDVEGKTAGHGLILGEQVLWPLAEELFVVDVLTGLPQRRVPLQQAYGISGGHLSLGQDRLLLVSPGRVTAFALSPVPHVTPMTSPDEAGRDVKSLAPPSPEGLSENP